MLDIMKTLCQTVFVKYSLLSEFQPLFYAILVSFVQLFKVSYFICKGALFCRSSFLVHVTTTIFYFHLQITSWRWRCKNWRRSRWTAKSPEWWSGRAGQPVKKRDYQHFLSKCWTHIRGSWSGACSEASTPCIWDEELKDFWCCFGLSSCMSLFSFFFEHPWLFAPLKLAFLRFL